MSQKSTCAKECHYGWVVVLAAALIRILVNGVIQSSGVVLIVINEIFNSKIGETSWVFSIINSVVYFVLPFSGMLINRFGMRLTAFLGGVICCVGFVLSYFATTTIFTMMTNGFTTGLGCGLAYLPCSIAVSKHFKHRMNLALGVASAGGGIGSFVFPQVIVALYEYFGWRGMFLMLGAITLNICVFGLLFRPVPSEDEEDSTDDEKKGSSIVKNDWSFLKLWQFHCILVNSFVFGIASSIVNGHLGVYISNQLDYTTAMSANVYSTIGISVCLFRIIQGFTANCKRYIFIFRPFNQFIMYTILGGLATTVLPFCVSLPCLFVYGIIIGSTFATAGGALIPFFLISLKGKDQLSLTFGVTKAVSAVGQLLGAPRALAGWIYDDSYSYTIPFLVAGTSMIVGALIMIFPMRSIASKSDEYEISVVDSSDSKL